MTNNQITIFKQYQMTQKENDRIYDLEERTQLFAKACRELFRIIPRTVANIEDGKQLIRSSGSVAANYIEANEALSKKDFVYRIKLCRKEVKESRMWLGLVSFESPKIMKTREKLIDEACQLMKIFSAIVTKID